jgi:hypothetical protein
VVHPEAPEHGRVEVVAIEDGGSPGTEFSFILPAVRA